MEIPHNELFKKQNEKLLAATFKRGIINRVNIESWTADVRMIGNDQNVVKNVPLSSAVDINTVAQGDRCRLDLFDETNPNDMVVAYTYGRAKNTFNLPIFKTGTATISTSGSTIAHGITRNGVAQVPDVVGFLFTASPLKIITFGAISEQITDEVYQTSAPDSTNIYLTAVVASEPITWYAIKF